MTLPIDTNVTFIKNSVISSIAVIDSYSVNDGASFGDIAELSITRDGITRAATSADLTNLKFFVPDLEAGADATIEYSIVVN